MTALPTINQLTAFTGGQFITATCFENNCVAAGDQAGSGYAYYPLLANSTDGGATWAYPDMSASLPTDFNRLSYSFGYGPAVAAQNGFNSASCHGNICVAGGSYKSSSGSSPTYFQALLAQSTDGGKNWTYPDISMGAPASEESVFWGVSCSGSTCVAVGEDYDSSNFVPFLAQSTNGGAWTYPQTVVTANPNYGKTNSNSRSIFYGVSCSGNNCVAVGQYYNNSISQTAPLLAQSSDGGKIWTYPTSITTNFVSDGPNDTRFVSASCNANVCIAAGWGEDQNLPLLAQSTNGIDWTYTISPPSKTTNLPTNISGYKGYFSSVSCGDNICVAVGQYNNNVPLLGQSFDNGVTWSYPTISTYPTATSGFFSSVSCSGSTCIASGQYTLSSVMYPLLAQTTDNGKTWTYPDVSTAYPSGFSNGSFNGSGVSSASLLPESLRFIKDNSRVMPKHDGKRAGS